ncbi:MAG: hypothetical protein LBU90_08780 [Bacteroidales bacterium]|jgi:hypothetical protein|nr:hypothetical protein [Bacteroidales bacterium]
MKDFTKDIINPTFYTSKKAAEVPPTEAETPTQIEEEMRENIEKMAPYLWLYFIAALLFFVGGIAGMMWVLYYSGWEFFAAAPENALLLVGIINAVFIAFVSLTIFAGKVFSKVFIKLFIISAVLLPVLTYAILTW